METSLQAPAYNGELRLTLDCVRDNTVGSLTERQRSIVIGSLLGDGAMRCKTHALLEVNHCLAQRTYVDWKYDALANLVGTGPKARVGNGSRQAYRFTTRSLPALTPFYRAFYGDKRKVVPQELDLSALALAVWFMDDGCKSYRALYLNTQQFDIGSQERLIRMLKAQWNVDAFLNRDKQYHRIRISVASVPRFKEAIMPHLLPEFAYKIPS